MTNFNFKATDIEKHSAAHVLAAAVKRLYPNVKVGIGPVTKNGFFYDFDLPVEINDELLQMIEKTANQIILEGLPFKQLILPKNEGYNMLLQIGQIYKAELLQSVPDDQVSLYKTGEEFMDLCRGPHVNNTSDLGIIKLTSTEKSNWKDDPSRPELQRVSGIVFQNENEYKDYLNAMDLSKQRDFLKLGKTLNYIAATEDKKIFLTEEGSAVLYAIENLIKKYMSFEIVETIYPQIFKDKSNVDSYFATTFKSKNRSYRNLPLALETINFIEEEANDNAFVFPSYFMKTFVEKQKRVLFSGEIIDRVVEILKIVNQGNYKAEIVSSDIDSALVKTLSSIFEKNLISHDKILQNNINKEAIINFISTDSIGKEWTLAEILIDSESDCVYFSETNEKLNASSFFISLNLLQIFGFLIEEFGKNIHPYLKPYQVAIIPQSKKHVEYCESVLKLINSIGIRTFVDSRSLSLKSKVKSAEKNKIPYIFIVGNKEIQNQSVSVRNNSSEVGLISLDNISKTLRDELMID